MLLRFLSLHSQALNDYQKEASKSSILQGPETTSPINTMA